ncbi:MAG: hypothetical protein IJK89_01390 [Clostridia bacterium]|nr:hypothetical protein [Clostridia bacterium]
MKKLFAVLICFALLFAAAPCAFAQEEDDETYEALQKMSFAELVGYMNANPPENDLDEITGYAFLLAARADEVSCETIEEIILDPQNCYVLRLTLMMLADDLSWPLDADGITAMARDKTADETLRSYALDWLIEREPVDRELFCEIARDETDPNSGWALKLLYLYDEKAARPIIDEVLADCSGGPLDSRAGTALLYKGVDLRNNGTPEEIDAFIQFCDKLLSNDLSADDRSVVVIAIVNVGTKESVSYIFSHFEEQSDYLAWAVIETDNAVLYEMYDVAEDPAAFAAIMRQSHHPLQGDMDGDGRVTSADARSILRKCVGLEAVSEEDEWDLDGDDRLSPEDARLALRTSVQQENPVFYGLSREKNEPIPIDDYILVGMTHEYSFPEEPYSTEYFHAEYVERVETIFDYHEGDLVDKEKFNRIETLYLTEKGKENIDAFIDELNAREDILCAERDYEYPMGLT